jgi:hypothetical protein
VKKLVRELSPTQIFEMWKCGKSGKHVGCAQGCEKEYGTYACWECPDPNAPSHAMINAHEEAKSALFGSCMKKEEEAEK